MSEYVVTKKAMRPASSQERCFYCHRDIGKEHSHECVLIKKKATVRMIVEYEVDIPNDWGESDVLFHRNMGSWCSDNAVQELEELSEENNCLCGIIVYEYVGNESEPFLDE